MASEAALPENLRSARKQIGLSQKAVAERLGMTDVTVSNHERGATTPDEEQLRAYAELYGWASSELRYGRVRSSPIASQTATASYSAPKRLPRELEILTREFELEAVKAGADEEDEQYIRQALRSPEAMQLYRGGYAEALSIEEQRVEMESLIEMLRAWLKERIKRRKAEQRLS